MQKALMAMFIIMALKSMIIGSDFNFVYWYKYGRRYMNWYDNRPQFHP